MKSLDLGERASAIFDAPAHTVVPRGISEENDDESRIWWVFRRSPTCDWYAPADTEALARERLKATLHKDLAHEANVYPLVATHVMSRKALVVLLMQPRKD